MADALPLTSMPDHRYTHVVLDEHSGEPLGAVRDIDELEDGTQFGVLHLFDSLEPPAYTWLRGLLLLPVSEAAPNVRHHLAWALRTANAA
jgi:hypothetical protein